MDVQTEDGLRLHVIRSEAEDPQGEVLLVHGYGEHSGRYAEVAESWTRRGLSVTAFDLRGHGRSEGPRGHVDRFEDYHRDLDAVSDFVRTQSEHRPFLFGHSMGGLLSLHFLVQRGVEAWRGLALSSPYVGLELEVPAWKVAMGRVLNHVTPSLGLATDLKGAQVASDPEIAARYDIDPLNNKKATVRWFQESQRAMEEVFAGASELDIQTLLLFAGGDVVASPAASRRLAQALPSVEAEELAGLQHEILNEPKPTREGLIERYADWFLARVAS
ncbi:MAG: lysophospholipase [Myxococcota bacterium]